MSSDGNSTSVKPSGGSGNRNAKLFLLLLCAAVCVLRAVQLVTQSPQIDWNGARLAATFGLLKGYHPYYLADTGPALPTIYGPFNYLYYLPCTLFSNVTLAIMAGSTLSLLAFLIPLGLVLHQNRGSWSATDLGLIAAAALLNIFAYQGLTYSAFSIHADAPAVFFSSLSILCFGGTQGKALPLKRILLSIGLGSLAVWTKQTFMPVLLLPFVVMWMERHPWKQRIAAFCGLAAFNAVLLIIFVSWFGMDALVENVLKIPAGHPFVASTFRGLVPDASQMFVTEAEAKFASVSIALALLLGKYLGPYILALGAVCVLAFLMNLRRGETSNASSFRISLPRQSGLFLLMALLNLPFAALAESKVGGDRNTETAFAWFVVLALLVLVMQPRALPADEESQQKTVNVGTLFRGVFAFIAATGLVGAQYRVSLEFSSLAHPFKNDQETVVEVCRRFPGQYYFPWYPLAAFMGEGKLYHFDYAIYDRMLAGMAPGKAAFFKYIPENARTFAILRNKNSFATEYFFGSHKRVEPPPGINGDRFWWYSFERSKSAAPSPP